MKTFEIYKEKANNVISRSPYASRLCEKIEEKTNINRVTFIFILLLILISYILIGYSGSLVTTLIGLIYPAYCSIKALETNEPVDHSKWLTYWIVYAIFNSGESLLGFVFVWLPFYNFIKCGFFIYLMMPGKLNGSLLIYRTFLLPYFRQHQQEIDNAFESANNMFVSVIKSSSSVAAAAVASSDSPHTLSASSNSAISGENDSIAEGARNEAITPPNFNLNSNNNNLGGGGVGFSGMPRMMMQSERKHGSSAIQMGNSSY